MDHILARIKGAKMEDVKSMLKADASKHAEQGLILRHIWRNADDPEEILFIFTTPDLNRVRKSIEMMQAETLKENPNANLPQMLFLRGE
jgi:muconolactone delta-isomerase